MSRITGVIVALATTAAVLTGSTGGAAEPPPVPGAPPGPADLPREIEGGVEVTLADGDLLRVWTSEDHRTVRARSYLYGSGQARRSRIVVLTRTGDAAPTRQEVDVDHACEDTTFANVDAHTTLFGYFGDPGQVAVIARADAAAPWALTQVAPEDAPGLVVIDRRLATQFFASPGGPLVALGRAPAGASGPRSSTPSPRRGARWVSRVTDGTSPCRVRPASTSSRSSSES